MKSAQHLIALTGIAGEIAVALSAGPGSFLMHFLDALSRIRKSDLERRLRMQPDV